MKLYIVENGLFHNCQISPRREWHPPGSVAYKLPLFVNDRFHALYVKSANPDYYKCFICPIRFPSILALPFEIIKSSNDYDSTHRIFIGSRKIFGSLKNRKYQILEI